MQFGSDHYTRDWNLLAGVADEWTTMRIRFGLGAKATRDQIEKHWEEMFDANKTDWPYCRRLHYELFRDAALIRHLRKCYWKELKPPQRKGYLFEEVLSVVLSRIFWTVIRNANAWLSFRGTIEHWARFWNTDNLTKELGRAIDDREESERSLGTQLQPGSDQDTAASDQALEFDYGRRRAEHTIDTMELFTEVDRHCSEQEARAFKDWWHNAQEHTDEEEREIARRHGLSQEELNALIRRIAAQLRQRPRS